MSNSNHIQIYDTTLRDGAQGEGINFSASGKIRHAQRLDELGVDYIEGGFPGSNPKDIAFFEDIRKIEMKHAKIAAFGSTRRMNTPVAEDDNIVKLLGAHTPVVTLVGKSSRLHVDEVLRTTEEENLGMIRDSVRYLKEQGREVVFDAEHFFQGYQESPEFAMRAIGAAAEVGVDVVVLCDTNGGTLPDDIECITASVVKALSVSVGIHTHNDMELGVANSLAAVRAGAVQVQGTINGFGERCGNANLCSIIATLELKMGKHCIRDGAMAELTDVSRFVDELVNRPHNPKAAFVGKSSFGHKGGLHANAVQKNPITYEHISPETVGNARRILISEGSGTSSVVLKALDHGVELDKSKPEAQKILKELKELENKGYEFEAADASFRLLINKTLDRHIPFFELDGYRVVVERRGEDDLPVSEATIKLRVRGEQSHTVAEADGPVDALDRALRKALEGFYPAIANVQLTDYRVRILDPEEATAATTRVLIESTDGDESWTTVGVSDNLIEASWEALVDSVEYKLFMEEERNQV
jgi:2-isopropylmalate synthase